MAGDEAEKKRAEDSQVETADANGGAGSSDGAEGEELDARVRDAVEAALAEQRDSVLRAQAEVQNMRRRCEMGVEKAHKFALERFATELLNTVDNLERALEAAQGGQHEAARPLYEGVELTLKGFMETLNKFGIAQINPEGEPFDPQLHEAIATQPNDEVEPNSVLVVVQKGYTLNERVIRPARVLVAKPSA